MPAAQSPAQDSIHLADADDWDQHWEAFAEAAARNPAQAYRRRLAAKLLEAVGPPIRLVDLGSGQGDFLGMAARRWPDAELLGVEPSRLGIAQSREKAPTARLELIDLLADTEIPDDLRGWATHALCSEVLEHVDDPCSLLASSRALLAPGCRLVVTVPGGPMSAFDRHIGHRRHFTPTALGRILEQAGYQVELATGAGFPFFNIYRRVVISRADRLVSDVIASAGRGPSLAACAAMALLAPLFRLNADRSTRGLQIVAVADLPRSA